MRGFIRSVFGDLRNCRGRALIIKNSNHCCGHRTMRVVLGVTTTGNFNQILIKRKNVLSAPTTSYIVHGDGTFNNVILSTDRGPNNPSRSFNVGCGVTGNNPTPRSIASTVFRGDRAVARCGVLSASSVSLSHITDRALNRAAIRIVSSIASCKTLVRALFSFNRVRRVLSNNGFQFYVSSLRTIANPCTGTLFRQQLGTPTKAIIGNIPLRSFNNNRPSPGLICTRSLIRIVFNSGTPSFKTTSSNSNSHGVILNGGFFIAPDSDLTVLTTGTALIPNCHDNVTKVTHSVPADRTTSQITRGLNVPYCRAPAN